MKANCRMEFSIKLKKNDPIRRMPVMIEKTRDIFQFTFNQSR